MKKIAIAVIASVAISGAAQSHSDSKPEKQRFIGSWHLISIVGPDGKLVAGTPPKGMLIYTADGHMSVQLMYPKAANALSNEYVQNGYEASFGTYDINDATHTVTHHVQGSNTRDLLVGKDLPRVYRFSPDGHLIIRSARPDEHWSVTWEHY
jgi:hypothetical protein